MGQWNGAGIGNRLTKEITKRYRLQTPALDERWLPLLTPVEADHAPAGQLPPVWTNAAPVPGVSFAVMSMSTSGDSISEFQMIDPVIFVTEKSLRVALRRRQIVGKKFRPGGR